MLKLIALGHTNSEIAGSLFLSVRTVESHRAHVQQKIGLRHSGRARRVRARPQSAGLIDRPQRPRMIRPITRSCPRTSADSADDHDQRIRLAERMILIGQRQTGCQVSTVRSSPRRRQQ